MTMGNFFSLKQQVLLLETDFWTNELDKQIHLWLLFIIDRLKGREVFT